MGRPDESISGVTLGSLGVEVAGLGSSLLGVVGCCLVGGVAIGDGFGLTDSEFALGVFLLGES